MVNNGQENAGMRRVLFVNILIILLFASMSYWTEEKEKLEIVMASNVYTMNNKADSSREVSKNEENEGKDYIKWVDFDVSRFALEDTYEYDRDTYGTKAHISWIDQLAWAASYTGGVFGDDKAVLSRLAKLREAVAEGEKLEKLVEDLEYFPYYQEAYGAVLGGMVGEYEIQVPDKEQSGNVVWEKRYGLKAFHPIAKGFPYNDYDDFGVSRSYGYRRNHLGHDMMGQTGTPVMIKTRIRK